MGRALQGAIAALIEADPPAASFTFGLFECRTGKSPESPCTYVIGTATTVAEAKAWAEVGADAICGARGSRPAAIVALS